MNCGAHGSRLDTTDAKPQFEADDGIEDIEEEQDIKSGWKDEVKTQDVSVVLEEGFELLTICS